MYSPVPTRRVSTRGMLLMPASRTMSPSQHQKSDDGAAPPGAVHQPHFDIDVVHRLQILDGIRQGYGLEPFCVDSVPGPVSPPPPPPPGPTSTAFFWHPLPTVNGGLVPDDLWIRVALLLPPGPQRRHRHAGRRRTPDRIALPGIPYVLRTGVAWRRLRDCTEEGVWRRLHAVLLTEMRAVGLLEMDNCAIDGSHIHPLKGGSTPGCRRSTAGVPAATVDPAEQRRDQLGQDVTARCIRAQDHVEGVPRRSGGVGIGSVDPDPRPSSQG